VLLLVLFGTWQRHSRSPLVDVRLFADRRFLLATVAFTTATFVLVGLLLAATQYLQVVAGHTALGTGVRLLPLIAGLILGAGAGTRLAATAGPRLVLTAGLLVEAAAALILLAVGPDTGYPRLGWTLALLGIGLGLAIGTGTDQVMATLPAQGAGAGAALSQTVRQVATALGVAVLGSLLNAVYTDQIAPATAGLPTPAAQAAEQSIGAAAAVAARLGPAGQPLLDAAHQAFVEGMHTIMVTSAITALAAAIPIAVWFPRPPAIPGGAGEPGTGS
jgi:Na+/melibiose symporter-like transporter